MKIFMSKLQIFALLNSIVLCRGNFNQCLQGKGQLLTQNICMFNTNETIVAPNIVVKPIARFTNLIECDKKSASLSAIFDIYLSWKDQNLVTNISNLDTVFFSKIWIYH